MKVINAIVACSVIAITSSSVLAQSNAVQWTVASGGNGHWYQVISVVPSETAEQHFGRATALGGHTATFSSAGENSFCFAVSGDTDPFIGVRKQSGNNVGAWITDEPWQYSNWHGGEGNNSWERYVRLNALWSGQWQDTDLTPGRYSVVEWESDCNADGIVDYGQILSGQLIDANSNGIPDCCESGTACESQSSAVQWTTASGGNGHWYLRWTDPVQTDWSAIGQLAASKGAQLLTVSSAAEQTFFFDLFGSAVIGLSAAPGSSEFVWATGEEVSFSNWGTSQCGFGPYPNNPNTNRRFVIMNFGPCVGSHGIRPAWDDYVLSELGPTIIGIGLEWSADCNSDGIVDYGQILSGQLTDANSNGIPDICEVDPCPGDISGNGAVDGVDLSVLLGVWGTDGSGGEFDADVTNDGIVNGADLTIILGGWGPCPN